MRSKSLVQKSDYPIGPYHRALICWEIESIPAAMGGLFLSEQKYFSNSPEAAKRRRWAMNRSMVYMLQDCSDKIVESVDRVYRLIDLVGVGTEYTYTGTGTTEDPYVISPAIPIVPTFDNGGSVSLLGYARATTAYVENLTTGQTNSFSQDPRNLRQQLEDILAALQAGGADPEQIALLQKILLTLGGAL